MTYSSNLFYGASAKTLQNAKELRKSMTPAERKLWTVLQNRQLDDYKFHRLPHPNSRYASLSGQALSTWRGHLILLALWYLLQNQFLIILISK